MNFWQQTLLKDIYFGNEWRKNNQKLNQMSNIETSSGRNFDLNNKHFSHFHRMMRSIWLRNLNIAKMRQTIDETQDRMRDHVQCKFCRLIEGKYSLI